MTALSITSKACPNCGSSMPIHRDYVTWCEKCDWGIEGEANQTKAKNRFEKLYDDLGKKQSREIFETISRENNLKPVRNRTRFFIFLLAGLVHLSSLGLLVGGIVLLVTMYKSPILLILAVVMLLLAWLMRPQPDPEPKEGLLRREEYPSIYKLVDEIAKALGARIDQVVLDEWYNASFGKTGWRQKNTLTIGYPLWVTLPPQERVALLAHEVAHAVNGDSSRKMFVGTAINSLITWYKVLIPGPDVEGETGLINLLTLPFRLFALLGTGIVWSLYRLLTILLYRDSQQAEYYADLLGATVSGREPYIAMLRKMFYSDAFLLAVQHCSLNTQKTDLYKEMSELTACMPEHEIERIRRLEDRNMSKLDISHPPTGFRIKVLTTSEANVPAISVSNGRMNEIDQELNKRRTGIQMKLIEHYDAWISR